MCLACFDCVCFARFCGFEFCVLCLIVLCVCYRDCGLRIVCFAALLGFGLLDSSLLFCWFVFRVGLYNCLWVLGVGGLRCVLLVFIKFGWWL